VGKIRLISKLGSAGPTMPRWTSMGYSQDSTWWDRTCEPVPVVLGTGVELADIVDAFEVNPFVS
jgi:hypothetical protein